MTKIANWRHCKDDENAFLRLTVTLRRPLTNPVYLHCSTTGYVGAEKPSSHRCEALWEGMQAQMLHSQHENIDSTTIWWIASRWLEQIYEYICNGSLNVRCNLVKIGEKCMKLHPIPPTSWTILEQRPLIIVCRQYEKQFFIRSEDCLFCFF